MRTDTQKPYSDAVRDALSPDRHMTASEQERAESRTVPEILPNGHPRDLTKTAGSKDLDVMLDQHHKPNKAQHSPLPWTMDGEAYSSPSGARYKSNAITAGGKIIGKLAGFSGDNAALIVRAVNSERTLQSNLDTRQ